MDYETLIREYCRLTGRPVFTLTVQEFLTFVGTAAPQAATVSKTPERKEEKFVPIKETRQILSPPVEVTPEKHRQDMLAMMKGVSG